MYCVYALFEICIVYVTCLWHIFDTGSQLPRCGLTTCSLLFVSPSDKCCQQALTFTFMKGFNSILGMVINKLEVFALMDVASWSANSCPLISQRPGSQQDTMCCFDAWTVHKVELSDIITRFRCFFRVFYDFTTLRDVVQITGMFICLVCSTAASIV